jgi:diguanylate cyclase (GGDEF)-like protein
MRCCSGCGKPSTLPLILLLTSALSTDDKTGLLTARAWREHAHHALRQGEHAHGLLVLDLDHFKAVNDTYGHLAGDRVLSAVAGTISTAVRAHDIVGRLGGEEFAVLINGSGPEVGTETVLVSVAERILHTVATLSVQITTLDGPAVVTGLTVSIGGARFPAHGPDLDTLLRVADAECYQAKAAGRNTVRVATPPPRRIRTGA